MKPIKERGFPGIKKSPLYNRDEIIFRGTTLSSLLIQQPHKRQSSLLLNNGWKPAQPTGRFAFECAALRMNSRYLYPAFFHQTKALCKDLTQPLLVPGHRFFDIAIIILSCFQFVNNIIILFLGSYLNTLITRAVGIIVPQLLLSRGHSFHGGP